MAQLKQSLVHKNLGEVNVKQLPDGRLSIKATILMKPNNIENAQTGLAIDGSRSMQDIFGFSDNIIGGIFAPEAGRPNLVQPVARKIAAYLANFDSDGGTETIYFACGRFGKQVERIGDISEEEAPTTTFEGPQKWGTGTCIVPAMQHFLTLYENSPWLMALIITDGLIDDLDEAKALSQIICEDMRDGKRGFTKFVVIGLGNDFNETNSKARQALEELDDLDEDPVYGVEGQDLWDHKIAKDMTSLNQIFAEVVTENTIIARSAEITDSFGIPVTPEGELSYGDGLPALLRFTMTPGSTSFTITLPNGAQLVQDISSAFND